MNTQNLQPTCNQLATNTISKWKKEFREYVDSLDIARDDWKGIIGYIDELPSVQPEQQNARIFQGVIVEYPTNSTYPEYEGKPYFLIKYTEDGQDFIGYGTYKPDVLSEYLKKYFMPPAQPETAKRIVGKSRGGMTLWYQCDTCNEPVDAQDNYCRGCGRRLIDE